MAAPPRAKGGTVLVAVFVVAVAIVVAAVYAILTAKVPAPPAPLVDFGPVVFEGGGNASVAILRADRELDHSLFRVDLKDLGTGATIATATVRPGLLFSQGAARLLFEDGVTSQKLGSGDTFRIRDFPTQVTYSLILVYGPEGRTLASATIPL